ncbi:hypothetical protein BDR06DRAFT_881717, partial [Suillus hirtellus]
KYDEGRERAHQDIDFKDERSIGNRLAAAIKPSRSEGSTFLLADPDISPLGPATSHGNEPSKGAEVDAEPRKRNY